MDGQSAVGRRVSAQCHVSVVTIMGEEDEEGRKVEKLERFILVQIYIQCNATRTAVTPHHHLQKSPG